MLPREPRIVDIAAIPDKIRIIKDFMFPSPNLMSVLVVQPEQRVIPIPNNSPPNTEDIVLSLIFMYVESAGFIKPGSAKTWIPITAVIKVNRYKDNLFRLL